MKSHEYLVNDKDIKIKLIREKLKGRASMKFDGYSGFVPTDEPDPKYNKDFILEWFSSNLNIEVKL